LCLFLEICDNGDAIPDSPPLAAEDMAIAEGKVVLSEIASTHTNDTTMGNEMAHKKCRGRRESGNQ
jgi:hypothetical protein